MTLFEAIYVAPPALTAQAPILVVAGPLIGACAAALCPGPRTAWMVSVLTAAFALWKAVAVAGEVAREGVIDYALGGFAPPMGIALRIDALGATMALLIATVGALGALYSGHALASEVMPEKHALFQAGYLVCLPVVGLWVFWIGSLLVRII